MNAAWTEEKDKQGPDMAEGAIMLQKMKGGRAVWQTAHRVYTHTFRYCGTVYWLSFNPGEDDLV